MEQPQNGSPDAGAAAAEVAAPEPAFQAALATYPMDKSKYCPTLQSHLALVEHPPRGSDAMCCIFCGMLVGAARTGRNKYEWHLRACERAAGGADGGGSKTARPLTGSPTKNEIDVGGVAIIIPACPPSHRGSDWPTSAAFYAVQVGQCYSILPYNSIQYEWAALAAGEEGAVRRYRESLKRAAEVDTHVVAAAAKMAPHGLPSGEAQPLPQRKSARIAGQAMAGTDAAGTGDGGDSDDDGGGSDDSGAAFGVAAYKMTWAAALEAAPELRYTDSNGHFLRELLLDLEAQAAVLRGLIDLVDSRWRPQSGYGPDDYLVRILPASAIATLIKAEPLQEHFLAVFSLDLPASCRDWTVSRVTDAAHRAYLASMLAEDDLDGVGWAFLSEMHRVRAQNGHLPRQMKKKWKRQHTSKVMSSMELGEHLFRLLVNASGPGAAAPEVKPSAEWLLKMASDGADLLRSLRVPFLDREYTSNFSSRCAWSASVVPTEQRVLLASGEESDRWRWADVPAHQSNTDFQDTYGTPSHCAGALSLHGVSLFAFNASLCMTTPLIKAAVKDASSLPTWGVAKPDLHDAPAAEYIRRNAKALRKYIKMGVVPRLAADFISKRRKLGLKQRVDEYGVHVKLAKQWTPQYGLQQAKKEEKKKKVMTLAAQKADEAEQRRLHERRLSEAASAETDALQRKATASFYNKSKDFTYLAPTMPRLRADDPLASLLTAVGTSQSLRSIIKGSTTVTPRKVTYRRSPKPPGCDEKNKAARDALSVTWKSRTMNLKDHAVTDEERAGLDALSSLASTFLDEPPTHGKGNPASFSHKDYVGFFDYADVYSYHAEEQRSLTRSLSRLCTEQLLEEAEASAALDVIVRSINDATGATTRRAARHGSGAGPATVTRQHLRASHALFQTDVPVSAGDISSQGQSASFTIHDDSEPTDADSGKRATWTIVVLLSSHGANTRMAICDEDRDVYYENALDAVLFSSLQQHQSLPPYLEDGCTLANHRAIKLTFLFWVDA